MSTSNQAIQTNHTTDGLTVMSTHKYHFTDTNDWSLCSDNHAAFFFKPSKTGHVPFNMMRSVGYPIGQTFTAYNHQNTTTVLQSLERAGMIKVFTCSSMKSNSRGLYTNGGPAGFDGFGDPPRLQEVPCNQALPPGRPVGNGMVVRDMPCGGTLLSEGHLEKIFNHAMHILHTEGPGTSRGPGFSVDWYEKGRNFFASETMIDVCFYFNGYPVVVSLEREKSRRDPCIIKILPNLNATDAGLPPVVSRTTRWRYWNDDQQAHDEDDDYYEGPCRNVEAWTDDFSFVDIAKAHKLGWDVSDDPREIERRAYVEAAVAHHRASAAAKDRDPEAYARDYARGQAAATARMKELYPECFSMIDEADTSYSNRPKTKSQLNRETRDRCLEEPDTEPETDDKKAPSSLVPRAPKTKSQLNREKRDRKKRGLAARRQQAQEAAEETIIDITDMVAEGMRSMGLEVVINVGESKPPSAARKRWQTAIQRQIKINRHNKEATAKNKAASEERARVRAAALAAKAAKKPAPFSVAGPSGPAPKAPAMPEEAPAMSEKAKRKGKKAISLEKVLEHEEALRQKDLLYEQQRERRRESLRKGKELGGH